jgi:hypothetical protein
MRVGAPGTEQPSNIERSHILSTDAIVVLRDERQEIPSVF